jgi:hypothetical protein
VEGVIRGDFYYPSVFDGIYWQFYTSSLYAFHVVPLSYAFHVVLQMLLSYVSFRDVNMY